jgi:hypothetical protein
MNEMQSETINELATALAKAQGEIEGAIKDSNNPYFKSKYADFHAVRDSCRDALCKHGLSFVQPTQVINEKLCLITILMHSSGQWIKGIMPVPAGKGDVQSLGSSLTYCRRYSLSSMVGVSTFDDDGEDSMKEHRKPKKEEEDFLLPENPNQFDLIKSFQEKGVKLKQVTQVCHFVTYSADKFKKTQEEVMVSAMQSEANMKRFVESYEKWLTDNGLNT